MLPLHYIIIIVIIAVVVGPTEFGERAHFILDSLADVPTTVESIVAEVWSSGVRVSLNSSTFMFISFVSVVTKFYCVIMEDHSHFFYLLASYQHKILWNAVTK